MRAIDVTSRNFESEVLKSEKPVLIDFWAQWCGPCRMLSPIIEEFAEENDKVKVCKINVDEEQELAEQYNIMGIPTLMVFKDGEPVSHIMGVVEKETIIALTDE